MCGLYAPVKQSRVEVSFGHSISVEPDSAREHRFTAHSASRVVKSLARFAETGTPGMYLGEVGEEMER